MPKTIWIINQYASTPKTGMGGRHYYLAKELAKQGHKVYLVAASYTHLLRHPPELKNTFKIESIAEFSFVWVNIPIYDNAHDKKRILNWFDFAWKLLKLPKVIAAKPDVILYSSPSLLPFLAAKKLAKRMKCKLAFEVRDIWPLTLVEVGGYSTKHPFIRLMQWIEDKAYRDSDVVLSNLPNAVEHMVYRGMSREKFNWIPNGLDLQELSQVQPLSDTTLAEVPKDKFIVGYTGTLGTANALESFIDAAALAKGDGGLAWVLVGAGKEKQKLLLKCKALGLENVYFINSIVKTQIQAMLALFDVCYIGLTKDPLFRFGVSPNKLFDYLYAAKPVIYAIESGVYLPILEADAGLSIPAESPKSIAEAVLELKEMSAGQRAKLGENAHNYALKHHDYFKLAKKLSKVLLD